MPEGSVNKPLSAREAVGNVFRKIDKYLAKGVCEDCAIRLTADEYRLTEGRVFLMWSDRDAYGYEN